MSDKITFRARLKPTEVTVYNLPDMTADQINSVDGLSTLHPSDARVGRPVVVNRNGPSLVVVDADECYVIRYSSGDLRPMPVNVFRGSYEEICE